MCENIRQTFGRSAEHLDQNDTTDTLQEQKQYIQQMIVDATPEQLDRVLKAQRVPARQAKLGSCRHHAEEMITCGYRFVDTFPNGKVVRERQDGNLQ